MNTSSSLSFSSTPLTPSSEEIQGPSPDEETSSSRAGLFHGHEIRHIQANDPNRFESIAHQQQGLNCTSGHLGNSAFTSSESLASSSLLEHPHPEEIANSSLTRANELHARYLACTNRLETARATLEEARRAYEAHPSDPHLYQTYTHAEESHRTLSTQVATLEEELNQAFEETGDNFEAAHNYSIPTTPLPQETEENTTFDSPGAYLVMPRENYEEENPTVFSGPPATATPFSFEREAIGLPQSVATPLPDEEEVLATPIIAPIPGRSFFSRFRRLPEATPSPEVTARWSPLPEASARIVRETPSPEE